MNRLKFSILAVASAAALSTSAIEPLWLRDVKISPDGTHIAFTYKGDIYKVESSGGDAVRLTTQPSVEANPVWSADSKLIAFASDRFGNNDIFVIDAQGGEPRRLSYNSLSEIPQAFSPDGKYVYFTANNQKPAVSALYPGVLFELYRVAVEGGRAEQVLPTPAEALSFASDGSMFLYQDRKGYEDVWRKHHTSSVTRDIWSYDTATGKHTNLTSHPGEDLDPVMMSDGNTFYFLSERNGGSMNVYVSTLSRPSVAEAVTDFATHPVRFLSADMAGNLCFTYDGEIYTKAVNSEPEKVKINIIRDDIEMPEKLTLTSGIKSASVSPDGKQVAFVTRGNVFVTSVEYGTTKQVTATIEAEADVDFGNDNRSLVYASERNGRWNIYKASIARSEDLNFPNATLIDEQPLFADNSVERQSPKFSPDGKKLAFIQDEVKLMVLDVASGTVSQVTDGTQNFAGGFNYDWSPDGKWLALEYIANGHEPYSDIAIVKADGSEKPINLTGSGYFSMQPRWVMEGNALLFLTDRYGMRNHASWGSLEDVMLVFMNKDAYDKYRLSEEDYELLKELESEQKKNNEEADKPKKKGKKSDKKGDEKKDNEKTIDVQLTGITDRIVRLTPNSSSISDAIITDDGKSLYYLSAFEEGYDLWKLSLREESTELVKKLNTSSASMQADDEDNIYILGGSKMKKLNPSSDKLEDISFKDVMTLNHAAEREYMFEHVCRQEARHFYVEDMHGVDWDAMTAAYRKFLPHINNNADFAELLSEMLGELNVSHTGGRYRPGAKGEKTANLGLLYDLTWTDKGMKVEEVIAGGPFDRATTKVKPGVIVETINGMTIAENSDFYSMLNGVGEKKTLIGFYDPTSGNRWEEVVRPISNSECDELLYKRWVQKRAEDVERRSNGRLGYVHIESMNDDSFRTVYSDVLGKYNKKEGIVIDTRFNGGGRLHEDIEILFSGEKYLTQEYRGRASCDMPSRRWNKPSIMVQGEANYSNAHGTPWVYKYKHLGKLVGAPVPGTMTSVWWETLQDPTLIFGTPVIGYRTAEGTFLENSQLEPDVYVLNAPEDALTGEDTQLLRAVDELLKQLDK